MWLYGAHLCHIPRGLPQSTRVHKKHPPGESSPPLAVRKPQRDAAQPGLSFTSRLASPAVKWGWELVLLLLPLEELSGEGKGWRSCAEKASPTMNKVWWCSINVWSTSMMAVLSSKITAPASFSPGFSFCRMLGPKMVAKFETVILFPGICPRAQKEIRDYRCSGLRCPRTASPTPGREHELQSEARVSIWVQFAHL